MAAFFSGTLSLHAQRKCATITNRDQVKPFENWMKEKLQSPERLRTLETAPTYQIPVVFHVVHSGQDLGVDANIPEGQIMSQIEILNQDFRRMNADTVNTSDIFLPVAVDTGIEFVLAQSDPNGNATTGINRVIGNQSSWNPNLSADDAELKSMSYWPAERYLNIWVTTLEANNGDIFLGYATFPETSLDGINNPETNRLLDGVVVDYRYLGIGFNTDPFSKGRTATHEIGHFLGLRHLDGDPRAGENGCNLDDFVEDTPLMALLTQGCPSDPFSCGSQDMIENYMDFTDDVCMNMFTAGQTDRMHVVLNESPRRLSLTTSPGLLPPDFNFDVGISAILNPGLVNCDQMISPTVELVNNGNNPITEFSIQVNSGSYSDTQLFSGSLASGETQSLTFTPSEFPPGEHEIRVEILNIQPADENSLNNIREMEFFVSLDEDVVPFLEDFESGDPFSDWVISNPDADVGWDVRTVRGNGSTTAAFVAHFNYNSVGEVDQMISPAIDLQGLTEASMTFEVAYALGEFTSEILEVWGSMDCGATFDRMLFSKSGAQLATAESNSFWVPEQAEDWRTEFVDLSLYAGTPDFRVAFLTRNGSGNNLYIDNIEFYDFSDPRITRPAENNILLYPNPTSDQFTMGLNFSEIQDIAITVMDAMGRILMEREYRSALNQQIPFRFEAFPPGVYFIRVKGSSIDKTERLLLLRE